MAFGDTLKAFTGRARSKSSNLYQNDDLVEELGYAQKPAATPTPSPATNNDDDDGILASLAKALMNRRKKMPTTGTGTTRG